MRTNETHPDRQHSNLSFTSRQLPSYSICPLSPCLLPPSVGDAPFPFLPLLVPPPESHQSVPSDPLSAAPPHLCFMSDLYLRLHVAHLSFLSVLIPCPFPSLSNSSPLFALYPYPSFLLVYLSIWALVLSREAWRGLKAVATRGPYPKQWHTSKSRGHLLCNSLKLHSFSGGPLTRLISTDVCTHTHTHRHTHTVIKTNRQIPHTYMGGIKLVLRSRGGRESGRTDGRKRKGGGRGRGQSDRERRGQGDIRKRKAGTDKRRDEREAKTAGGGNWWRNWASWGKK